MYLFDLGRDLDLSKEELFSRVNGNVIDEFSSVVVMDCDIKPVELIKLLGGTIRIVELKNFHELPQPSDSWSFSGFNVKRGEYADKLLELKSLFGGAKSFRSVRKGLVNSPSDIVKRVDCEYVFARGVADYWGVTVAFFNPEEHEFRDSHRPATEPSQAISIRLAKILISLSRVRKGDSLLDPFCGVGTILQEALIQGVRVFGADVSTDMIGKCERNLEWISKQFKVPDYSLLRSDSRSLGRKVDRRFEVVVSEPFMGPLIRGRLTAHMAYERVSGLNGFYIDIFEELSRVLKSGGRVVFILPRFLAGKNVFDVETSFPGFRLLREFEYAKRDNRIVRRICVFEKF